MGKFLAAVALAGGAVAVTTAASSDSSPAARPSPSQSGKSMGVRQIPATLGGDDAPSSGPRSPRGAPILPPPPKPPPAERNVRTPPAERTEQAPSEASRRDEHGRPQKGAQSQQAPGAPGPVESFFRGLLADLLEVGKAQLFRALEVGKAQLFKALEKSLFGDEDEDEDEDERYRGRQRDFEREPLEPRRGAFRATSWFETN